MAGWWDAHWVARKVAGEDVPCAAGIVEGRLILQVLATIPEGRTAVEIR